MRGEGGGAADAADLRTGSRLDIELQLGNARACEPWGGGRARRSCGEPAQTECRPAAARPPAGAASAEAIHDFGDVILRVGEGRRSRARTGPAPAPINAASRALCGTRSSVESGELGLHCRRRWQPGLSREGGPAIALYPLSAARCSPPRSCHPHSGRSDHFFFFFNYKGVGQPPLGLHVCIFPHSLVSILRLRRMPV